VLIECFRPVLEKYFVTILQLLYTKLQNNPSDSYKRSFVCFYHLVSAKTEAGLGADFFIAQTDAIQANIFTPIYLQQILPISQTLARPVDRKVAVISFAKSLAQSQAFAQRYQKGWRFTCEAMLTLLANAPTLATGGGNEAVNEADVDDIGFGMGFTPLNTCRQPARDEFPQVQDVPQWVKQYLTQANASSNNAIAGYVQERLTDEGKQALAVYIS
jgi:exportin-2 (importin alpha re-exporter)